MEKINNVISTKRKNEQNNGTYNYGLNCNFDAFLTLKMLRCSVKKGQSFDWASNNAKDDKKMKLCNMSNL